MVEGVEEQGTYSNSTSYFRAIADTAIGKLGLSGGCKCRAALGAFVFCNSILNTTLYADDHQRFPMYYVNLGTHNILAGVEFNFLAIIDWGSAQTAL